MEIYLQVKGETYPACRKHPLNAEIDKKLLEKAGCEVTWVKNGQEAVSIFAKAPENMTYWCYKAKEKLNILSVKKHLIVKQIL